MVAERQRIDPMAGCSCSLAKISMVAELKQLPSLNVLRCSLAKISMVAERMHRSLR